MSRVEVPNRSIHFVNRLLFLSVGSLKKDLFLLLYGTVLTYGTLTRAVQIHTLLHYTSHKSM